MRFLTAGGPWGSVFGGPGMRPDEDVDREMLDPPGYDRDYVGNVIADWGGIPPTWPTIDVDNVDVNVAGIGDGEVPQELLGWLEVGRAFGEPTVTFRGLPDGHEVAVPVNGVAAKPPPVPEVRPLDKWAEVKVEALPDTSNGLNTPDMLRWVEEARGIATNGVTFRDPTGDEMTLLF